LTDYWSLNHFQDSGTERHYELLQSMQKIALKEK